MAKINCRFMEFLKQRLMRRRRRRMRRREEEARKFRNIHPRETKQKERERERRIVAHNEEQLFPYI
jgi:hypothetical protein